MTVLSEAEITLRVKKYESSTYTVKYFGQVIYLVRLIAGHVRGKSLVVAKKTHTQTELRFFLGLVNVYEHVIPKFSKIAATLSALIQKRQPPKLEALTTEQTEAFQSLMKAVTSAPILAPPQKWLPSFVDTDSSDYQVGCTLFRNTPEGESCPICYCSRTRKVNGRKYSVLEKECLAMVWALGTLRPYLMGILFTLYSDQSSCGGLMNMFEPYGRLIR